MHTFRTTRLYRLGLLITLSLPACAGVVVSSDPPNQLSVSWQTTSGYELERRSCLLRWKNQPPATTTAITPNGWLLTWPDGITATITPPATDQSGASRFKLAITNTSDTTHTGIPFPPLTQWLADDHPDVSPQHIYLQPPWADIGTLGRQRAWYSREFWHHLAAFQPAQRLDWMLTAVLLVDRAGPTLKLEPRQTVTATLYLDAVPGDRNAALDTIYRQRGGYRVNPQSYDMSQYLDPTLEWVRNVTAGWITWSWDPAVMDPTTGEYNLFESLHAAQQRFGGYDVYMFWPFWPRAGIDARFQFDHFANMPGGLPGLRAQIQTARNKLGTRFIIASCHWSETSRDDSPAAFERSQVQLVETALALDADGVVMDLLSATPEVIRRMAREHGRDLMPYSEGDPSWEDSQTNLVGRIHDTQPMPAFNLKRYMLPHHGLLRVCAPGNNGPRWERDFTLSFFNGHGIEINHLLGGDLPSGAPAYDRLAIILDILRTNRASFRSPDWEPLVESFNPRVWINRWPTEQQRLYTLVCTDPAGHQGPLFDLAQAPPEGWHVVDLWRQRPLETTGEDGRTVVYDLDPYVPGRAGGSGDYTAGCIAVLDQRLKLDFDRGMLTVNVHAPMPGETIEIWRDRARPGTAAITRAADHVLHVDLYRAFGGHTNEAVVVRLLDEAGQLVDLTALPEVNERFFAIDRPERTPWVDPLSPPAGMVRVAPSQHDYIVQLGAPVWQPTYNRPPSYVAGGPSEARKVNLAPFWIDRYPVTNAEFKRFLDASGYLPENSTNFLAHWEDGAIPAGLADHPVVYVSYRDANAYAAWAGKRLPTEEEWQAAAGWERGQPWPWGEAEPTPAVCNVDVGATTAVDAHPAGASLYGVEDMVGNVWQWTTPRYRATHAEVVFLRGGSWYIPPENRWFVLGGPRKINDHQPLPLFGPAMNRLATVGFRCVQDEERVKGALPAEEN